MKPGEKKEPEKAAAEKEEKEEDAEDEIGFPLHISGLWVGQAVPHESFKHDTPVNPIRWSLTLLTDRSVEEVSAFGAGYFDDAGDIPNQPVLFYTLRGKFQQKEGGGFEAIFDKVYETKLITDELRVRYRGTLGKGSDGQPFLSGTWKNEMEGTHGTFVARMEELSPEIIRAIGSV